MFVTDQQTCWWCKGPMPHPLPDGTIYNGGWIHPECNIAKEVADRLMPKKEILGTIVIKRRRYGLLRKTTS